MTATVNNGKSKRQIIEAVLGQNPHWDNHKVRRYIARVHRTEVSISYIQGLRTGHHGPPGNTRIYQRNEILTPASSAPPAPTVPPAAVSPDARANPDPARLVTGLVGLIKDFGPDTVRQTARTLLDECKFV